MRKITKRTKIALLVGYLLAAGIVAGTAITAQAGTTMPVGIER